MFPDQTQDPKLAGRAEMLEAVCPGHIINGKEIQCEGPCSEDRHHVPRVLIEDRVRKPMHDASPVAFKYDGTHLGLMSNRGEALI